MKITDTSDRFWLLTLAMGALVVLGLVSVSAIGWGVPDKADTLIGGIATGLLLFMRDIVTAIRGFWSDAQTSKITDQLAASPPPTAGPTSDPDAPVSVTTVKS